MKTLQERLAVVFPPPLKRGLQAEIARLCGVQPPSVNAWFKNPEKVSSLERSWAEKICATYAPGVSPVWLADGIGDMQASIIRTATPPPIPPRDYSDRREVSPSEWGLLQDVLFVMTDAEVQHIKERAKHAREAMKRDEKLRAYLGSGDHPNE